MEEEEYRELLSSVNAYNDKGFVEAMRILDEREKEKEYAGEK